jgi:lysozyme
MSDAPFDFIDVSHWQGQIDWPAVANLNSDLIGVIAKATEDTGFVDKEYANNRAGALSQGLRFSSYHYLHPGNGEGQMRFYLEVACPREGERVVLDYEEENPPVDMATLQAAICYLREVRPDLQITVYGAAKLTDDVNQLEDTSWLTETSLWVARYSVNEPNVGKAWETWTAWQFTDGGEVMGIDGGVDLNTFNGSPPSCAKWFGPTTIAEPETVDGIVQAQPSEPFVTTIRSGGHEITVQIDAGDVAIWVDGEPWEEAEL